MGEPEAAGTSSAGLKAGDGPGRSARSSERQPKRRKTAPCEETAPSQPIGALFSSNSLPCLRCCCVVRASGTRSRPVAATGAEAETARARGSTASRIITICICICGCFWAVCRPCVDLSASARCARACRTRCPFADFADFADLQALPRQFNHKPSLTLMRRQTAPLCRLAAAPICVGANPRTPRSSAWTRPHLTHVHALLSQPLPPHSQPPSPRPPAALLERSHSPVLPRQRESGTRQRHSQRCNEYPPCPPPPAPKLLRPRETSLGPCLCPPLHPPAPHSQVSLQASPSRRPCSHSSRRTFKHSMSSTS